MSFWGVELCSLGGGDVPFWGVEMCQIWGVEMRWDEVIHDPSSVASPRIVFVIVFVAIVVFLL